jgi:hypothetical protein
MVCSRAAIFIGALAIAFSGGAMAAADRDAFAAAMTALSRGDYATAESLLGPLAQKGNAAAEYNLGRMYAYGNGVPRDYAIAVNWYQRAAAQGAAPAQNNLGSMYLSGRGVPQDFAEAAKWFQLAADKGFADAQKNLGDLYLSGKGLRKNPVQALMWYELAVARYPAVEQQQKETAAAAVHDLAGQMTPEQTADVQKMVSGWKPNS